MRILRFNESVENTIEGQSYNDLLDAVQRLETWGMIGQGITTIIDDHFLEEDDDVAELYEPFKGWEFGVFDKYELNYADDVYTIETTSGNKYVLIQGEGVFFEKDWIMDIIIEEYRGLKKVMKRYGIDEEDLKTREEGKKMNLL